MTRRRTKSGTRPCVLSSKVREAVRLFSFQTQEGGHIPYQEGHILSEERRWRWHPYYRKVVQLVISRGLYWQDGGGSKRASRDVYRLRVCIAIYVVGDSGLVVETIVDVVDLRIEPRPKRPEAS